VKAVVPPVDVAPIFMCGRNALAIAWGQMPRPTERKEDDYGMLLGRGKIVYDRDLRLWIAH